MMDRLRMNRTAVLLALYATLALSARAALVSGVGFDRQVFNPSAGQSVSIHYQLAEKTNVTVTIHDPDGRVIRTLANGQEQTPGLHVETWDGRDVRGAIVPDEAYYPVLRAETGQGQSLVLDPSQDSGGEPLSGITATYDPARGVVRYVLPETARVRILAGVADGPLLATIVPNLPRVAGLCEEPWNGMDTSGKIKVVDQKGWRLRVDAFRLPRWSILARGNKSTGFVSYTLASLKKEHQPVLGDKLVALARRPRVSTNVKLSPFASQTRILDQPPKFTATIVGDPQAPQVEVALNPLTASLLNEVRFEVVFYMDFKRMGEEEQAYSPMRFVVPRSDVSPGEHLLTVNVASLTGQLGSQTLKINIPK